LSIYLCRCIILSNISVSSSDVIPRAIRACDLSLFFMRCVLCPTSQHNVLFSEYSVNDSIYTEGLLLYFVGGLELNNTGNADGSDEMKGSERQTPSSMIVAKMTGIQRMHYLESARLLVTLSE
jgi:hypothetical protein